MRTTAFFSSLELLLSFLGTAVAGFIYYHDRAHTDLPCTTGGGCDLVQASHWSHIFGQPVALFGLCAYVALALLSVIKLTADSRAAANTTAAMIVAISLSGTLYSWYLQYVAAVFIGAFCIWCRTSAITISLIFLSSLAEMIKLKIDRRSGTTSVTV